MKTKEMKHLFWAIVMLCSIALIGFGSSLALADVDSDGNPIETPELPEELGGGSVVTEEQEDPAEFDEAFGDKTQATWIGAHEFMPYDSDEGWTHFSTSDPHIWSTTGNGIWCAVFRLPSGARVTEVKYYYYDGYGPDNIRTQFWRANSQTSHSAILNFKPAGSFAPGYATSTWFPGGGGYRIMNGQGWYYVCFDIVSGTNLTRFWGVRILWNRSQAPAGSQIFSDVGFGDPFYQSINNMYRSGITTGCPSPPGQFNYCPDRVVTRGQMAAFLARALGLYWAYPTY